ncbi:MAG: branched-chain amino acid aminotransferase [Planctomycetaceae bacterium]
MLNLLRKLQNDECGFVQAAELVLISTITVIGVIVGLSELTWNVNTELKEVGEAFSHVNQSYEVYGNGTPWGGSAPTSYNDQATLCGY